MIIENTPVAGQQGLARLATPPKAKESDKLASGLKAALPEEKAADLAISGDLVAKRSEDVSRRLDVAQENFKASEAEITDFAGAKALFAQIRQAMLANPEEAAKAQGELRAESVLKLL